MPAPPPARRTPRRRRYRLEDEAEVLTYSRSRGLFAGLELSGAVIQQDKGSTREFYGRMVPFKTSLKGEIEAPKPLPLPEHASQVGAAGSKVVPSWPVASSQYPDNWQLATATGNCIARTPRIRSSLDLGKDPGHAPSSRGARHRHHPRADRLRASPAPAPRWHAQPLSRLPRNVPARAPPSGSRRIHFSRTPARRSLPLPPLHPRKCLPRRRL